MLLAFRAADQRAREMVLLALHPFWQEAGEGKVISYTSDRDVVP